MFTVLLKCFVATSALADFTMNFNSLPSAQGWAYTGIPGISVPESSTFFVYNGALYQDTLYGGGGAYFLSNSVAPLTTPSTLSFTVSALQISGEGFSIFEDDGTRSIYFAFVGTNTIQLSTGSGYFYINNNNMEFHNYTIENTGTFYQLYIDGSLAALGTYSTANPNPDMLFIGQGTMPASAQVVMTAFSYAEGTATPIPGAIWVFGSGLVGLIGFKRRYLG